MSWNQLIKHCLKSSYTETIDDHLWLRNEKTSLGSSPLHFAVIGGCMETIELLTGCGNINSRNFFGETALHWASKEASSDVVLYLLGNGARPNCVDYDGDSPLHWAAEYDRCDILSVLMKHGANPNQRNSEGETPLEVAKLNNSASCVALLESIM